ncbi:3TM-type holin [Temperatibacter marinus]|uniref:3TM-type holin n=1 Tax=Temperatibacter marinus TaxID=1456591 RepID=A0AA52H8P7_9PROT|nr:3TM-type holin [Temperatibacter marinus]WND02064.1 3TM-type holin [Temperatibacter marinus]
MSLLSLLKAVKPSASLKQIGAILDQLFTSEDEKLSKKIILERLSQEKYLAQTRINEVEAAHASLFVAGWRPFVGWICALALAWHFIFYDMINWIMTSFYPLYPSVPPLSSTETLITVLLSILGIGGLRTFEKYTGVNAHH